MTEHQANILGLVLSHGDQVVLFESVSSVVIDAGGRYEMGVKKYDGTLVITLPVTSDKE